MRPEELMIGDWVELTDLGYGVRVSSLGVSDMFWYSDETACHRVPYEKVAPLYLGDSILRDNGFVLLEVGDHGTATPPQFRARFEKWLLKTQWQDVILWYDRRTEKYNLHDMNGAKLQFVHELQHALRLAGIDFDIEL